MYHTINISKYNPLAGSSYIRLRKELDHPRKGLINIQNTDVQILNSFNPELKLKNTEYVNKINLIDLLNRLKRFKFVTTLVSVFKKIESKDKTKHDTSYLNTKSEIIISDSDIDDVFQSIYTTTMSNIQNSLGKDSVWIIDSVIDQTISILKYNPLAGNSYIRLPKELDHPRKGFINIQNIDDNECFKWC